MPHCQGMAGQADHERNPVVIRFEECPGRAVGGQPMKTKHEFVSEMTRKNARESLMNARNTLERALQEMDSYVAQFDGAATDGDRAKILNWTINHLVSSIQPNLRIDMLADRQSELAKRG